LTAIERRIRILNMSSLSATEDLTARARIIAAALDRFAALGYRATTVRSIATDAGVSPALIIHHFGGKEGLRRECDERIVRFVAAKQAPDATTDALTEAARRFGPYLARMLGEASDAADSLFDTLLGTARRAVREGIEAGTMRASADREAQAAVVLTLGVAPFFLAHQLARWSGGDAEAGIARIAGPLSDIYARGLLIDSQASGGEA
jgi:AcrR family transcriptional regulator